MTDSNIENLATDITLHMLDILQQYTKGFKTETNEVPSFLFSFRTISR